MKHVKPCPSVQISYLTRSFFSVLFALFFTTAAYSQNQEGRKSLELLRSLSPSSVQNEMSLIPVNDMHWVFLGCVRSLDHCHHAAEGNRYHHYRVEEDHHTCHHEPHLACYAGESE